MIDTKRHFIPDTDRYAFDLGFCSSAKGWAQLDTRQDASYYGNWLNPAERKLVSYAEGDIAIVTCETDDEFRAEVDAKCAWHEQNDGKRPGIDPGFSPELKAAFEALGLGHWLH